MQAVKVSLIRVSVANVLTQCGRGRSGHLTEWTLEVIHCKTNGHLHVIHCKQNGHLKLFNVNRHCT